MSISTLIIGESGTGKTTSLRHLDGDKTLLIQVLKKSLPFRNNWSPITNSNLCGTIANTDESRRICEAANFGVKNGKTIIIIDDFQYVMANEFMRKADKKGFEKFTQIAKHAWDVIERLTMLPDHVRVYILSHCSTSDDGFTRCKTIGKMLDEKIVLEGMFTNVLRTSVINGKYQFCTQNSGQDTVKTPMRMFDDQLIDNDLKFVDLTICEYYGLHDQIGRVH